MYYIASLQATKTQSEQIRISEDGKTWDDIDLGYGLKLWKAITWKVSNWQRIGYNRWPRRSGDRKCNWYVLKVFEITGHCWNCLDDKENVQVCATCGVTFCEFHMRDEHCSVCHLAINWTQPIEFPSSPISNT